MLSGSLHRHLTKWGSYWRRYTSEKRRCKRPPPAAPPVVGAKKYMREKFRMLPTCPQIHHSMLFRQFMPNHCQIAKAGKEQSRMLPIEATKPPSRRCASFKAILSTALSCEGIMQSLEQVVVVAASATTKCLSRQVLAEAR